MHPLVTQLSSLQQYIPIFAAIGIALVFFVLGRGLAARKYAKALRASAKPSPSSTNFPLNRVDPCPRPVACDPSDIVFELIEVAIDDDLDACDSASATSRFSRAS